MAEVTWTEPALQELNDIAEYIALDNPAAASRLVKQIFESTGRLEDSPHSGRTPPELPNSVYREIVAPPLRIFYRVDNSQAIIVYVMREERQLRTYIFEKCSQ